MKEFSGLDINSELKQHGIDFSIPMTTNEAYLLLEWFDDSS